MGKCPGRIIRVAVPISRRTALGRALEGREEKCDRTYSLVMRLGPYSQFAALEGRPVPRPGQKFPPWLGIRTGLPPGGGRVGAPSRSIPLTPRDQGRSCSGGAPGRRTCRAVAAVRGIPSRRLGPQTQRLPGRETVAGTSVAHALPYLEPGLGRPGGHPGIPRHTSLSQMGAEMTPSPGSAGLKDRGSPASAGGRNDPEETNLSCIPHSPLRDLPRGRGTRCCS